MFWDVRQRWWGQCFGGVETGANGNSLLLLATSLVGVSAVVVGGHERRHSYSLVCQRARATFSPCSRCKGW